MARGVLLNTTLNDRFEVREVHRTGGFGVVYRAWDKTLSREVAIKSLEDQARFGPEGLERFKREVATTSKLTHACAPHVSDCGTKDDVAWYAMDLLEGPTLDEYLQQHGGRLSPAETFRILGPICDLLTEAHGKGIIHRDLKPENVILVSGPGGAVQPKLIDFGIARLMDSTLTRDQSESLGTWPYMPREQWEGNVDVRSDLYSLGVIAYQCLSGKLPLEADSAEAWWFAHSKVRPRKLTALLGLDPVSRSLDRVVMKALEKRKEARQQSAAELKTQLEAATSGRPIPATPATSTRIALAVAIAAGAIATPVVFLFYGAGPPALAIATPTAMPTATPDAESPVRSPVVAIASLPVQSPTARTRVVTAPSPIAPAGWGSLSVSSEPWGEIFVDGVSTGRETPAFNVELPAGKHEIRIVNAPSRLEARFSVEVVAGETIRHGTVTLVDAKTFR